MDILIKGGRLLDPVNERDGLYDLWIRDGKIWKVKEQNTDKEEPDASGEDCRVVDASGCYVMPGLIDLHVHLRDPGFTYKETVDTGAEAAAHGGFTTIVAMPNTKPVMDEGHRVSYVHNKAKMLGLINVLQAGAVTKGMRGEELSDIENMVKAGSPAISEDGKSVMNSGLYRKAMKIAKSLNIPVLAHCEDINMVEGGVVNADKDMAAKGWKGITNAVEDVIVARDILLAKETGARLHLCHCSTKDSVRMVKAAKLDGVDVSAEVCPHHFTLTSADIPGNDANYKMNPPLRTKEDVEALKQGLHDNIMDVIATDHAPHSEEEKLRTMQNAPFGIVGLETAVPLTISELVRPGVITPLQMAAKMSTNPARILGIYKGNLAEGKIADVTIIDPEVEYTIDKNKFRSMGKNTPFHGRKVFGEVEMTICGGKIVYDADRMKQ